MNEVELIRAQLSLERQHATAVSHALSAAATRAGHSLTSLDAFREASVEYLVWTLSRFEEREQMLHDLVRTRLSAASADRRRAEEVFALPGTSREALARLEAALRDGSEARPGPASPLWAEFLQFFEGAWRARRDALDTLFAQHARITDWRAMAAIDADSIFEERNRYSRVRATLPAGIELSANASV
jgi:hypothetical protein